MAVDWIGKWDWFRHYNQGLIDANPGVSFKDLVDPAGGYGAPEGPLQLGAMVDLGDGYMAAVAGNGRTGTTAKQVFTLLRQPESGPLQLLNDVVEPVTDRDTTAVSPVDDYIVRASGSRPGTGAAIVASLANPSASLRVRTVARSGASLTVGALQLITGLPSAAGFASEGGGFAPLHGGGWMLLMPGYLVETDLVYPTLWTCVLNADGQQTGGWNQVLIPSATTFLTKWAALNVVTNAEGSRSYAMAAFSSNIAASGHTRGLVGVMQVDLATGGITPTRAINANNVGTDAATLDWLAPTLTVGGGKVGVSVIAQPYGGAVTVSTPGMDPVTVAAGGRGVVQMLFDQVDHTQVFFQGWANPANAAPVGDEQPAEPSKRAAMLWSAADATAPSVALQGAGVYGPGWVLKDRPGIPTSPALAGQTWAFTSFWTGPEATSMQSSVQSFTGASDFAPPAAGFDSELDSFGSCQSVAANALWRWSRKNPWMQVHGYRVTPGTTTPPEFPLNARGSAGGSVSTFGSGF